jgi:hypothetical protein
LLKRFHEDLKRVGLRARRQHDARRTFRSLAVNNGGDPHFARWITHGRPGDVDGLYTEAEWSSLCAVVRAIPVRLREPKVLELRHTPEQAAAPSTNKALTASKELW